MTMNKERPEISAAEQAYLLAIRQSRGGDPLSAADLARRMRVSPQATSEMLRRLAAGDRRIAQRLSHEQGQS
jgi:Mn-dependent DtxR family transcriptional regulator